MDRPVDRFQLASDLWTQPFENSLISLRIANSHLVGVLEAQIRNQSKVTESFVASKSLFIDGMLMDLCRAQSQKKVPLLTAALGILGEANKIPRDYHDWVAAYHRGAAPSEKWVDDIIILTRDMRPPAVDICLTGIAVATFDNLTMNVSYQSYVTEGEGGYKLDMTNWFSTFIPRHLARPHFDAREICE
jgi:hypothetical protein